MPLPAARQALHCANGGHAYTREPRRGPKPRSCPDHPALVADPRLTARLAAVVDDTDRYADNPAAFFGDHADAIALAFAEEIAVEAEAHASALRAILARRRARTDLIPEDRSHQRQQSDAKEAAKQREAALWMSTAPEVRTAPPRVSKPTDDDKPLDDDFRSGPELGGQGRLRADWPRLRRDQRP